MMTNQSYLKKGTNEHLHIVSKDYCNTLNIDCVFWKLHDLLIKALLVVTELLAFCAFEGSLKLWMLLLMDKPIRRLAVDVWSDYGRYDVTGLCHCIIPWMVLYSRHYIIVHCSYVAGCIMSPVRGTAGRPNTVRHSSFLSSSSPSSLLFISVSICMVSPADYVALLSFKVR